LKRTAFKWSHDHIHLRCRDVEATARFYGEMFGGRVFHRRGGGSTSITEVDLGGLKLFLSPAPTADALEPKGSASRLGVWQLSFRVKDLDAAVAELKGKGVAFPKEPVVLASGARAAFFEGPDGVEMELIQRPPIAARPVNHGAASGSSGWRER